MSRIEQELGRPVVVERSLGGVPVVIDEAGSASLRLKDLAFALHASVVLDDHRLRLERTRNDQEELSKARITIRRRKIEAGLARLDQRIRRAESGGDDIPTQIRKARERMDRTVEEANQARAEGRPYAPPADLIHWSSLTPAGRLCLAVLERLGPEKLATLASGEVRFYSNRPNSFETLLPDVGPLLARFGRMQDAVVSATGTGHPWEAGIKLNLRLDERGASLQLFDPSGRRVDASGVIYESRVVYVSSLPLPSSRKKPFLHPLSEPGLKLLHLLFADPKDPVKTFDKALPDEFLHPEKVDPLEYVGEALVSMPKPSKVRGRIFVLSDGTIDLLRDPLIDDRIDTASLADALFKGDDPNRGAFEQVEQNGVSIIRPQDLLASESTLVDRKRLGVEIRRIVKDRRISVLNWPSLNLALFPFRDSRVAQVYRNALLSSGLPRCDGSGDEIAKLALLGATVEAHRQTYRGNEPVLQNLLRDGLLRRWIAPAPEPGTPDLATETSTLLTSSLDTWQLILRPSEIPLADRQDGSDADFAGVPADRLGLNTLYLPGEKQTEEKTRARIQRLYLEPHYRLVRRKVVNLVVQSTGTLPFSIELSETAVDRNGVSFNQLPPIFRDGIIEGVRQSLGGTLPLRLFPSERKNALN